MKYAYTGQKHPFFWVLAPGLPLFTVSFKRYPANTAAFHCRSGEQHPTTVFLAPCKGIQDSLGFWIPCYGFSVPRYWIPDSVGLGYQILSSVGFRIP